MKKRPYQLVKYGLLTVLFMYGAKSNAIEVVKTFLGQCRTDSGVLLDVKLKEATILNFSGEIQTIPIHRIRGLARYSVTSLPSSMRRVNYSQLPNGFSIETRDSKGNSQRLLGWVTGYTAEAIQIFDIKGREYQIERKEFGRRGA